MMLNENHQKSTCEFAAVLVSYLYDELKNEEKSRFESHLKTCSFCPDEIADFVVVRSSIIDWRETDFSSLPTPLIEIPYQEKRSSAPTSRPWFKSFRDFFTLSPAWITGTTAFAALAICIGLGFILFNTLWDSSGVVVQEDSKTKKTIPSPTTDISKQSSANSEIKQTDPNPAKSPTPIFPSEPLSNPSPQPNPVKSGSKTNSSKPQNLKKPVPSTEIPKRAKKGKAPSLLGDEEEEEDTLTLTDLLEEIGMR
jgi:hypothetical protein